jgi:hypothetical protein
MSQRNSDVKNFLIELRDVDLVGRSGLLHMIKRAAGIIELQDKFIQEDQITIDRLTKIIENKS